MIVCQHCTAQSPDEATFCRSCGQRFQQNCPSCLAANVPGSQFCANCGNRLSAQSAPAQQPASYRQPGAPVSPSVYQCPRCHQPNEPGAAYCFSCGLPLDASPVSATRVSGGIPAFASGSPGGFWVRVAALLVDSLIIWSIPIIIFRSQFVDWISSDEIFTPLDFWLGLIELVYHTVLVGVWATTGGKRLFGLFVVRPDGSKVGLGRAFCRSIAIYPSVLLFGIGVLMIAFRADKRGLHDLICDTVVIKCSDPPA